MEEVIETEEAANVMTEEAAVEEEETQETEAHESEEEVEEEKAEVVDDTPAWAKKRFDTLTFQREEARREAQAIKEERDALRQKLEEAAKSVPPQGKPKLEDFETDEEYFDKLTDWKLETREKAQQEANARKQDEQSAEVKQREFVDRVSKVNQSGNAKYKDYSEVIDSMPAEVMDYELASLIVDTDAPEDIAYHLGKNPKEAARISGLPLHKKALALGRIEARLGDKKTSNAPPPITPVKGKDTGAVNIDDLSPEEYFRMRNEGKI